MTINKQQEYDTFINKFVSDNWDTLLKARKYRSSYKDREGPLDYTPDKNEKADANYIGISEQFSTFTDKFLNDYIFTDGLKFDLKGHFPDLHGRSLVDVMSSSDKAKSYSARYFFRENIAKVFSRKLIADIFQAFIYARDNSAQDIYYHMFAYDDNLIEIKTGTSCPTCDGYVAFMIDFETNTIISHGESEPCKLPTSSNKVTVTLKSPSGKLVFLNDPSQFFKLERDNQYDVSINSTLGCIEETKFHAKHNIGYFFIGNTTAYIMQKEGEILATLFDDENDKQAAKYKDYKMRGDVCTGVWWYTVLDHDLYLKLCEEQQVDPASIEHTVVKTKALKYKVSHSLAAHKKGHHVGVYSKITY